MPKTIALETAENFSFRQTVYSHGWCDLRPFELDEERWRLGYVFAGAHPQKRFFAVISADNGNLRVEIEDDDIDERSEKKMLRDIRHILRLDDDLSDFYDLAEKDKRLGWIRKKMAGRLMRSPTVFEDLIKTVCTTNCSWGLTKKMVTNLVEKLGAETASGKKAFPTPDAMAAASADFYRKEIRAGYRSPYFVEIAEEVASGRLDPEKWLHSDLPTAELKKELKKVKGVGDYAAEHLLKLIGRYDGLALDSWLRAQFSKKHNREKPCSDKDIAAFYDRFGSWRGLALWCDMTEEWFD